MGGVYKSRPGRASKRKSVTSTHISDFDVNASVLALMPPIGAILEYYRPDATISLPDNWKICDGSAIIDPRSLFNGMNLPDKRSKMTRGKTDMSVMGMDSSGSDTKNLQHSHTVNDHTHTGPSHTHPQNVGSTGGRTTGLSVFAESADGDVLMTTSGGSFMMTTMKSGVQAAGTGATGGASPGTDNQLSTTQDILPAYVGMIYIMRIF